MQKSTITTLFSLVTPAQVPAYMKNQNLCIYSFKHKASNVKSFVIVVIVFKFKHFDQRNAVNCHIIIL